MQRFRAGAVEFDVVCRPADPELLVSGGQFADQVGEASVVGVASGFGAQDGHRVVGDLLTATRFTVALEASPGVRGGVLRRIEVCLDADDRASRRPGSTARTRPGQRGPGANPLRGVA